MFPIPVLAMPIEQRVTTVCKVKGVIARYPLYVFIYQNQVVDLG
jgi:hypothetical protein